MKNVISVFRNNCPLVRIFILTLMLLSVGFSFAQTNISEVKAELNKITQAYTQCKQLSLTATSTWYTHSSDQKPAGSRAFTIKIKGGNLCYKMEYMERVSNSKYSVILDHKDKTIILDKGTDLRANGDPRKFFRQDEMLKSCSSIHDFVVDADTKAMRFMYKNSLYHSVDVVYNSKTYMVEKVVMIYSAQDGSEGGKVEIKYTNIDSSTPIDDKIFSVSPYVLFDKARQAQVTPAYKEYFFVNHLN